MWRMPTGTGHSVPTTPPEVDPMANEINKLWFVDWKSPCNRKVETKLSRPPVLDRDGLFLLKRVA
ncbi:hypothetical protein SBA1_170046 [Candidatus Sulfotelmatobacter kueseliae]|uniref:Uncharacterized protein n=1 Tax=Candidatus Sulfotelmatobacter kueseliae TaxID=2042962 RepID=A0A2U3KB85_9BACT|nr:hypothetical protein SBA1_170046 [Candidatus Sulfotelmatobacter kueseliae]